MKIMGLAFLPSVLPSFCWGSYNTMDRTDWVLANPAQIVLNGSQVRVVLVQCEWELSVWLSTLCSEKGLRKETQIRREQNQVCDVCGSLIRRCSGPQKWRKPLMAMLSDSKYYESLQSISWQLEKHLFPCVSDSWVIQKNANTCFSMFFPWFFLQHFAAVGSVRKEALPANPGLDHASPQGRSCLSCLSRAWCFRPSLRTEVL